MSLINTIKGAVGSLTDLALGLLYIDILVKIFQSVHSDLINKGSFKCH